MAANYNCLLLDLDGTLLDFEAAERVAISATLQHFGLPHDEEAAGLFHRVNAECWHMLERGEIKKEKLLTLRFSRFLEEAGAKGNPAQLNSDYAARLAEEAPLIPGADEFLAEAAEFCTLAATTNAIYRVQTSRLEKSGLLPFFDGVFVSEKMGAEKPSARFFDAVLRNLGVQERARVLVVGDSLTADIKGAANAKLDSCWCNFSGKENTTDIQPTHIVRDYAQLLRVAVGEEELANAALREKRHLV